MALSGTMIKEQLVYSILSLSKIIERKDGYFAKFKFVPYSS